MLCPFCEQQTVEWWQKMWVQTNARGEGLPKDVAEIPGEASNVGVLLIPAVRVRWMMCGNARCRQTLVEITRRAEPEERYLAVPRRTLPRRIDPLVEEKKPAYAALYAEAALVLEDSPRASAALSRRLLADVLDEQGGYGAPGLAARIDAFIEDVANPATLTKNLDYLREIGNFGAHTQKDDIDGSVIDVEQQEAEWTLDVLDRLLDFYIVGPETDRRMRERFDDKVERAGRDPLGNPDGDQPEQQNDKET